MDSKFWDSFINELQGYSKDKTVTIFFPINTTQKKFATVVIKKAYFSSLLPETLGGLLACHVEHLIEKRFYRLKKQNKPPHISLEIFDIRFDSKTENYSIDFAW